MDNLALVRFNDGTLMSGTFNDTSDMLNSNLRPEIDGKIISSPNRKCTCSKRESEDVRVCVFLATNWYITWTAKACKKHMVITEQQNIYIEGGYLAQIELPGAKDLQDSKTPPRWWPWQ